MATPPVVEQYIASCEASKQPRLQAILAVVRQAAPDAGEKISYGMPTFHYKRNFFHFAAQRHHIGLYPGPAAIEHFAERLKPYKTSKGTIQIQDTQDLDLALIRDLVLYNIAGKAG